MLLAFKVCNMWLIQSINYSLYSRRDGFGRIDFGLLGLLLPNIRMRRSWLCLFGNSRLHRSIRKDHAFYHRLLHSQSDAKGKPWILVGRPRVMDGYVGRIHTWLVLYSVWVITIVLFEFGSRFLSLK